MMGHLAAAFHRLGDAASVASLVASIANSYGVDPALVMSMIRAESGFNATAHRPGGEYGLMQVALPTAAILAGRSVTPAELYDPAFNIGLGVKYLAQQLARYGGNVRDSVAAYNAGTARQSGGVYVNSQGVPNVQAYVDNVMSGYTPTVYGQQPSTWEPVASDTSPAPADASLLTAVEDFGASLLPTSPSWSWTNALLAAGIVLVIGWAVEW